MFFKLTKEFQQRPEFWIFLVFIALILLTATLVRHLDGYML